MKKHLFFVLSLLCIFFLGSSFKRALVTGGAGFLGSHLCERLLAADYEVICLDDLSCGQMAHIEALLSNPRFHFVQEDVRIPFDPGPIDEIYNLASSDSGTEYQSEPIKTFLTHILGALNVLELAKKYGATVFLASTREIYGDLTSPRACHNEGKRGAETLFFDYHRQYGVKIKVARIFNTYGPRMAQNDGNALSYFIVQALKGMPLVLEGYGTSKASFCYVSDMIEAIYSLMQTSSDFIGPIPLGNPDEISLLQLAQKILSMTDSSSNIVIKGVPEGDFKGEALDISVAKSKLGWEPKIALEVGLQKTIDYFKIHSGGMIWTLVEGKSG